MGNTDVLVNIIMHDYGTYNGSKAICMHWDLSGACCIVIGMQHVMACYICPFLL